MRGGITKQRQQREKQGREGGIERERDEKVDRRRRVRERKSEKKNTQSG